MTLQRLADGSQNPAWVAERIGKLGGSQMDQVVDAETGGPAKGQGKKPSVGRQTLARNLAAERWADRRVDNVNPNKPDIKRGIEDEPIALRMYEARYKTILRPAQWIEHPDIENAGCTPDSFRRDGGLIQVKTHRFDIFIERMLADVVPKDALAQIVWEQTVCKAPFTHLVMHSREMPPGKQLHVIEYRAPQELREAYEEQVRIFMDEVEMYFTALSQRKWI